MVLAKNRDGFIEFDIAMANRHGLIAGATGTGKSVTLKVLAEAFSSAGSAVFLSDVKGDLGGFAKAGQTSQKLEDRLARLDIHMPQFQSFPTIFWDLYANEGHPVRTTVSQMGPLILSRILNLNETQSQILSIIFQIADDEGLLLLDTKDLKALLGFVGEHAKELRTKYGNFSSASLGAITRAIVVLQGEGGEGFFGEPALEVDDLLLQSDGKGHINILNASKLINSPRLYSSFLLWLLSELFETLPEVGDVKVPKLVFFFDEAHLLFENAPKVLLEKIEQLVRLIRSKGVGVFFVTQSVQDIPEDVLAQLSNKIIHSLRAFTPKEQKNIKALASAFMQDGSLDLATELQSLGVGEAIISTLDSHARPTHAERAFIMPPQSSFGPLSADEMQSIIRQSPHFGFYEQQIDRESAYEMLTKEAFEPQTHMPKKETPQKEQPSEFGKIFGAFASSAARAIGSKVGREIVRGILGAIVGSPKRRR